MTTNHTTSEVNAGRRPAVADGSFRRAGVVGGMGNCFIKRHNSVAAQKSGAGSASLEETHLRPGCKFGYPRLQRHSVSHESGSEKLQPPFLRASAVTSASAREIHGSRFIFCLLISAFCLLLSGCVSAHKKGRTIHERFDYAIVQAPGCEAVALLTCHEIWKDEWTGGGRAFLADPKASELVSLHTNQNALGGSSTLTIGSIQSEVSTNGIIAAGHATGEIIQDAGAAAGQLINKSVTGKP